MTQLPFIYGSPTSEAAATQAEPSAETLRGRVLAYVRVCGGHGSIDEEIQIALEMSGNTQRPRRRELELAGLIRDSGLTRKTVSGRDAVVWVAT